MAGGCGNRAGGCGGGYGCQGSAMLGQMGGMPCGCGMPMGMPGMIGMTGMAGMMPVASMGMPMMAQSMMSMPAMGMPMAMPMAVGMAPMAQLGQMAPQMGQHPTMQAGGASSSSAGPSPSPQAAMQASGSGPAGDVMANPLLAAVAQATGASASASSSPQPPPPEVPLSKDARREQLVEQLKQAGEELSRKTRAHHEARRTEERAEAGTAEASQPKEPGGAEPAQEPPAEAEAPKCHLHSAKKPNPKCKFCQRSMIRREASAAEKVAGSRKPQELAPELTGRNEDVEDYSRRTFNCSPMLKEQILQSSYFKSLLDIIK
ncbi:unnamed protein product [Prorocentrum cordatum]|uniref:Pre-mRNA-splicing factor 38 n=1 Tax=Prorocentrum cordatum TaxID=2364126 RepID=A0ABN9VIV9_9DINO|nr:unnamed protein product [Polarella glacialis]